MKIDQEKLCEYCTEYYKKGNNWSNKCAGKYCEDITEIYKEKHEMGETKTFKDMCLNDDFYVLGSDSIFSTIETYQVTSLFLNNNVDVVIETGTQFKAAIPEDSMEKDSYENVYLNETDAKAALKQVCIDRITKLSEIIGKCK